MKEHDCFYCQDDGFPCFYCDSEFCDKHYLDKLELGQCPRCNEEAKE